MASRLVRARSCTTHADCADDPGHDGCTLPPRARGEPDARQRKAHPKETMKIHPETSTSKAHTELVTKLEHDAAGAVGGAAAGAAAGMIAGPAGIVAGAIVGGLVGAVATALVDRDREAVDVIDEADQTPPPRDLDARPSRPVTSEVGAFSAASMGVATGSPISPAEGPISPPGD